MTSLSEDLSFAVSYFSTIGLSAKAINRAFNDIKSKSTITVEDLGDFQRLANDLPYVGDRDYGALLLEQEACRRFGEQKKLLLDSALERADYCAYTSTSGGEGLSRSSHVTRIKNLA